MTDFALEWDAAAGAADLVIENNDLKADDGLRTPIQISLFTNRRAEPGDVLPDGETNRQGWWADAIAPVPGDKIGSRLWLLARSKREPSVLDRAQTYAREALAWLLEDSICERVDVLAEFLDQTGIPSGLALTVTMHRPAVDPARFRFDHVWAAEESRL